MKVCQHIGSHKTGNTAIQDFASSNYSWLVDIGLLHPSLYVVDCLAKNVDSRRNIDPKISTSFNNFAFKNPISTNYSFLDRECEKSFSTNMNGNEALLEYAPHMSDLLFSPSLLHDKDPIDKTCYKLVEELTEAFNNRA
jgi:hypothetical protein